MSTPSDDEFDFGFDDDDFMKEQADKRKKDLDKRKELEKIFLKQNTVRGAIPSHNDDEDNFMKKWREQRTKDVQMMRREDEEIKLKKTQLKKEEDTFYQNNNRVRGVIPSYIYKRMTQTFNQKKNGNCQADIAAKNYVARGSEINAALRSPDRTLKDAYKADIQCLDTMAQPLINLLPAEYTDDLYIIVYRAMYTKYDENMTHGYTSTSNMSLKKFGENIMKIYIPLTTKVLLADISHMVSAPTGTIFEIVLPKNTELTRFGRDIIKGVDYYFVEQTMSQDLAGTIFAELNTNKDFERL
jgi:hypothetical protein